MNALTENIFFFMLYFIMLTKRCLKKCFSFCIYAEMLFFISLFKLILCTVQLFFCATVLKLCTTTACHPVLIFSMLQMHFNELNR